MIDTKEFYDCLVSNKMDFFTGVPDSLLANICACIKENSPSDRNIIAANEGNAVGIACGYRSGSLHGQHINAGQIPDLVPCLALCAALCEGTTVIDHAERLRIKESDRLTSTAAMINSLGGNAEATEDGLIIHGVRRFKGGTVHGYRDHRIVMAAAVGALSTDGEVTITTPHSVSKSYPSFFEVYNSLGGKANVIDMGK